MRASSVWFIGSVVLGCSNLPGYAAPSSRVLDPSAVEGADLIAYRELQRDDFLAEAPPADRAEHAHQLGALTCAFIVTTPDTGYEIRETRTNGVSRFNVRFKTIGLVARMDRKCSWWNPDASADDDPYVLQHEQIHFALTEAEARRRSQKGRQIVASWSEDHDTADEAATAVKELLSAFVNDAMQELLEVNTAFDEETSIERSPSRQQQWFER